MAYGPLPDIVTSAPSVEAAAAATLALVVAGALETRSVATKLIVVGVALCDSLISDPAQVWNAGDRYGDVAALIRQASDELGSTVRAGTQGDLWTEGGRDAFVTYRVTPYADLLGSAAGVYDNARDALHAMALVMSAVGVLSMTIGRSMALWAVKAAVAQFAAAAELDPALATIQQLADMDVLTKDVIILLKATEKVGLLGKVGEEALLKGITKLARALTANKYVAGGSLLAGAILADKNIRGLHDFFTGDIGSVNWPTGDGGAAQKALASVTPAAIKELGKKLDDTVGTTLTTAYNHAVAIAIGVPGFGLVLFEFASLHADLHNKAVDQLATARSTTGEWLPGLHTTAQNWSEADQSTKDAVKNIKGGH